MSIGMANRTWEITADKISAAVRRIVDVAHPQKVIVFGSAARGETTLNSDVDFLVVTRTDVESPRRESVRIRRALRGIGMPMDVLVISADRLREVGDRTGLLYRTVLREGLPLYEAAEQA